MVSEEDIRYTLHDYSRREIAIFCSTPRSPAEIVTHLRGILYPKGDNRLVLEIVNSDLKELEKKEVIEYIKGKWKTSELAIDVLKKYYGIFSL